MVSRSINYTIKSRALNIDTERTIRSCMCPQVTIKHEITEYIETHLDKTRHCVCVARFFDRVFCAVDAFIKCIRSTHTNLNRL